MQWKKGDMVEFWLERKTESRWQVAEVVDTVGPAVMILPWHSGHEIILHEDKLHKINCSKSTLLATLGAI